MTVEFECGFSIYPPLPPTPSNQSLYALFLACLRTTFPSQVQPSTSRPLLITDTDNAFYYFTFPKHPKIPANPEHCNYFLSFCLSFGSGGLPREVAVSHVLEVFAIAKKYFGERVRYWNGMHRMRCNKQWGYYTLADVEEAEAEVMRLCRGMDFKVAVMETVVETLDENHIVEVGPLALLGLVFLSTFILEICLSYLRSHVPQLHPYSDKALTCNSAFETRLSRQVLSQ